MNLAPSPFSADVYLKALRFAASAHGAQKVPGTDHPYLVHVCSVAAEVIAALQHEPQERPDLAVQCALLHDVAEDTPVDLDVIEGEFGPEVRAGVSALSKNPALSKDAAMADSLLRIQAQPREVWLVKLADRITNLQPAPAHWTADKRRAYRIEAEGILAALGSASAFLSGRFKERLEEYRAREA
jgi:guanosine-3',5'-bis(diphosphate) 3'-pyrophosphohydrolase